MRARTLLFAGAMLIGGLVVGAVSGAPGSAGAQDDQPPAPPWRLVVDAQEFATFERCIGFGSETDVTDFESTDPSGGPIIIKGPGDTNMHPIVCRRPASASLDLWAWREAVSLGGPGFRRSFSISRAAHDGQPALVFFVSNGWPSDLVTIDEGGTILEVVSFSSEHIARTAS